MNKVILIGNVGQDPELRYTQGGQAVLNIRMATTDSWVDKSGERKETTNWATVVVWGKRAEGIHKLIGKGSKIAVEGRLSTRSWEAKDGTKRYSTDVVAEQVELMDKRGEGYQQEQTSRRDEYGEPPKPGGGARIGQGLDGPAQSEFADDGENAPF